MAKAKDKSRIENTVRAHVAAAFRELLSDPDAGQAFRPAFETRLRKSISSARSGHVKSFADVFKRYRI